MATFQYVYDEIMGIRDERRPNANTATRVGTALIDLLRYCDASEALAGKVDKVAGWGLSQNDLTDVLLASLQDKYTQSYIDEHFLTKTDAASTYLTKEYFNSLFRAQTAGGADIDPNDTSQTVAGIKAMVGVWTNQYLSSLGLNASGNGGSGDVGATALADLTVDTLITSPAAGQVLKYSGGKWKNLQLTKSDISDFAHTHDDRYYTETEADNKFVAKVSGKGLSEKDFTTDLYNKLMGIDDGANAYVHPTGGANTTISAANGKVLSAITVNSLGHVTSVSSKTLAAADIPTLTKSKISDFPTTWAWSAITGTPTTLAGYGITDAATSAQMTAATGRISTLEGYFNTGGVAKVAAKLGTATVGGTAKPIYLNAGVATALSATVGSATKGVFLSSGTVTAMTYSLSATVNAGAANRIAYYSGANAIDDYANILVLPNTLNSANAYMNGLRICGQQYGNSASYLLSGEAGVLQYGDGGPQIIFSSMTADSSSAQSATMLFTCHDTPSRTLWGCGYSFHFLGDPNDQDSTHDVAVVSDSLVAKKRIYLHSGVYLEYDATNGGVHLVGAGVYADNYVSALGLSANGTPVSVSALDWSQLNAVDNDANHKIDNSHLNFDINDYALKTWVQSQGYLTSYTEQYRGTVTQVKVGTRAYNPESGVVSLPAYPTSLPASDVYAWAKAATKPTYSFSDIASKPTTLSGYGITDAATSAQMTAATGRIGTLEGYFTGGVANSAVRLSGTSAYTAWGQTYWENGAPKGNVKDTLYMLATGANVNSDSAKLKFNSWGADGTDVYRSPYIQAIYENNHGRKRLSVFQSNAANYTADFNEVFTILPNGNVGINTITPAYKLDVSGSVGISNGDLNVTRTGAITGVFTENTNGGYDIKYQATGKNYRLWFGIGSGDTNRGIYGYDRNPSTGNTSSGKWYIYFTDNKTILNYGNVGIGTTDPTEKLHVSGNIVATGAVSALGISAAGSNGGALSLLTDVNITSPSNGQVLTYSNGNWVNGASNSNATTLGGHSASDFVLKANFFYTGGAAITPNGISMPLTWNSGGIYSLDLSGYLPLSAGSGNKLTNSLHITTGYGITAGDGNGLLVYKPVTTWGGIDSTQWGVGAGNCQGVIRTNSNDIIHYRGGANYQIWDAYNLNPKEKYRVQVTGATAGWHHVADIKNYGSLLFSVGGGWSNGASTVATFHISHHHSTNGISQIGTSYLGVVTKVRIRDIHKAGSVSGGWIAIDVYVASDTTSILCAEVISLDSRPIITMFDFTTNDMTYGFGGTADGEFTPIERTIENRAAADYLPLTAGSSYPLTGDLYMNNACFLMAKDKGGTARNVLGINNSGTLGSLLIGYGSSGAGIDTNLYGNNIYFRNGTNRGYAVTIFADGSTQFSGNSNGLGIILDNNKAVCAEDTGGDTRKVLSITDANNLYIGEGIVSTSSGGSTYIYGKNLYLKYRPANTAVPSSISSLPTGISLTSDGYVGIGIDAPTDGTVSGSTSANALLHVNGKLRIGDGFIEWDSVNNMMKFSGGNGIYTMGAVSGLGMAGDVNGQITRPMTFTDKVYFGGSGYYIYKDSNNAYLTVHGKTVFSGNVTAATATISGSIAASSVTASNFVSGKNLMVAETGSDDYAHGTSLIATAGRLQFSSGETPAIRYIANNDGTHHFVKGSTTSYTLADVYSSGLKLGDGQTYYGRIYAKAVTANGTTTYKLYWQANGGTEKEIKFV